MSKLSDQIEMLFSARGYKWRIGGEPQTPTSDDIEKVLRSAKSAIDNEGGDEVQFEIGRLIVRKEAGHYDVYVYFGELE